MLRAAGGVLTLALVLVWVLAADFALDWLVQFSRPQRMVVLAVCGGIALWALGKFIRPVLTRGESQIDLALLVQRQRGIDSDLVAALQFESQRPAGWGSPQLEGAVVDHVADFSRGLGRRRPGGDSRVLQLVLGLSASALLFGALAVRFPEFTRTFIDRFLLGSSHYPTRTMITRIVVNGVEVFSVDRPLHTAPSVPFGHAARFEVFASGVLPKSGQVRIVAQQSGDATQAVLEPEAAPSEREVSQTDGPATTADNPNASSNSLLKKGTGTSRPGEFTEVSGVSLGASPLFQQAAKPASYAAELSPLVESVIYQVYLGDAWTDPMTIDVLPLPVVSLTIDHTPPAYARAREARQAPSSRQISVIEGSRIELFVQSSNKPLARADLVIGPARFPLEPQDESRQFWRLPRTGTPLARVAEPIAFEVEVLDDDGLSPEQPLRGHIRIETDHPPRVAAAVVTDKVLPGAQPTISWGAADDFGLAELRLQRQITRANGEVEQAVETIRQIPPAEQPQTNLRGRFALDLRPLAVAKGDEVRVTLEAIDFRGTETGSSARSDPIVFQVTDESGILAGLADADEKSARQLDQIIQRQLGIGER
jgi:hypothetical protein